MDGTLDGLRVGVNLRVGLAVGEPVVGAVVLCRRDGAGVRFTVAREVGLLEKVVVGFLVGLNERFDVGFEVGEREDGRVEGVGDGMEVEGFKVDGRAEGTPRTKVGFVVGAPRATVGNTVGAAAELLE